MSFATKLARVICTIDPDPEAPYECGDCGAQFDLDRQTCPDCDGCTIDRADWVGAISE